MKTELFSAGVAILAAGSSTRMGRAKMFLPWGDTTIVGEIIARWRTSRAAQIAPVCKAGDAAVAAELRRLGFSEKEWIVNEHAGAGMFSSIQAAAAWTGWDGNLSHLAIALGDQPQISTATLSALLQFSKLHPAAICQPSLRGRPKHPVILPRVSFRALATTGLATLREFLEAHSTNRQFMDSQDETLDFDLDLPEEYEAARRKYAPFTQL